MSQLPIGIRNSTSQANSTPNRGATNKIYSLKAEDFVHLIGAWDNKADMQLPCDLDPELDLPCADAFIVDPVTDDMEVVDLTPFDLFS